MVNMFEASRLYRNAWKRYMDAKKRCANAGQHYNYEMIQIAGYLEGMLAVLQVLPSMKDGMFVYKDVEYRNLLGMKRVRKEWYCEMIERVCVDYNLVAEIYPEEGV